MKLPWCGPKKCVTTFSAKVCRLDVDVTNESSWLKQNNYENPKFRQATGILGDIFTLTQIKFTTSSSRRRRNLVCVVVSLLI